MVFGVHGPKAALSSYLASALSSFLVVDPTAIEADLVGGTKIVLRNVQIRDRTWHLRRDEKGRGRSLTLSGSIDELVLTWAWSIIAPADGSSTGSPARPSAPGWVRDVLLTARGFKLKLQMDHDNYRDSNEPAATPKKPASHAECPKKPREQTDSAIKAYMQKEIQQIIDSLTVRIRNFEFTLELPPNDPIKMGNGKEKVKPTSLRTAFVVGSEFLQLISLGRQSDGAADDTEFEPGESRFEEGSTSSVNPLWQEFSMGLLYANIVEVGEDENDSSRIIDAAYPLIEPFNYSALVTRTSGQRFFGGLGSGLEAIGRPRETLRVGHNPVTCVVLHAKSAQIHALSQLIRVLFPPKPATSEKEQLLDAKHSQVQTPTDFSETSLTKSVENVVPDGRKGLGLHLLSMDILMMILAIFISLGTYILVIKILQTVFYWAAGYFTFGAGLITLLCQNDSVRKRLMPASPSPKQQLQKSKGSVFKFPFSPLSIVLEGDKRIAISTLTVTYNTDGHTVDIEAPSLELESGSIDSPNKSSLSISMTGIVGSVVPIIAFEFDSVEDLTIPDMVRIGTPLNNIAIQFVGGTLHISTASAHLTLFSKEVYTQEKDRKPSALRGSLIPFPVSLRFGELGLQKNDADKIWYSFDSLRMNAEPNSLEDGVKVALSAAAVKSQMLQLHSVRMHALAHPSRTDIIEHLNVVADSALVASGYSSVDWSKMANFFLESKVIKFPFAYVAALPVQFSIESNVWSTGETEFDIPPFVGDSNTTSNDLNQFYSQAVLSRAPDFITNAEFMGLNVADTTLRTAGPYIFAATPLGPLGGSAALVAYDGIKGTINRGKEARDATPNAAYKPGDFSRGLIRPTLEPMKAVVRGDTKKVTELAAEAAEATGEYAEANKARLGGAAVGGFVTVGVCVVATPLVGIPAGIVAGAVTEKAIKELEKTDEDPKEESGDP